MPQLTLVTFPPADHTSSDAAMHSLSRAGQAESSLCWVLQLPPQILLQFPLLERRQIGNRPEIEVVSINERLHFGRCRFVCSACVWYCQLGEDVLHRGGGLVRCMLFGNPGWL